MSERVQEPGRTPEPATVRLASVVAGDLTGFDPTEDYHEASRLYPGVVDPLLLGAARLEQSVEVRASAGRSVKRHAHLPFLPLPPGDLGSGSLERAIAARRSRRTFSDRPLHPDQLGGVLRAAYGTTGKVDGTSQSLRTVPSGGALYPLELYVACLRVDGIDPGLYHFDPLRHGLERLRPVTDGAIAELSPYEEQLRACAACVLITAMFWRSRFKYGARSYRFTLLEAGHVAQNLLLAVAALGLAAVPIGGFFDRRVDELLGIDGIYEASLYLVPLGAIQP